jgi:hypothetical protein
MLIVERKRTMRTSSELWKNMTMTRNEIIEACKTELAINFDCPAKQILRVYGAKLGISGEQMDKLLRSLIKPKGE